MEDIETFDFKALVKELSKGPISSTCSEMTADFDFEDTIADLENQSFKKSLTPEDLRQCESALSFLAKKDFGSTNEEFELVAKALSNFISTKGETRATEMFIEHCISVGGDFDEERDLRRFRSFANGPPMKRVTPKSLFRKASDLGWSYEVISKEKVKQRKTELSSLFVRFDKIECRPPQWLVEGLFEQDAMAVIYGPPAGGKSFIALNMAFSVASGVPFLGREVKQGAVFYIAGEGHNGLAQRRTAWEIANGVSLAGMPLFLTKRSIDMTADAESLVPIIEQLAIDTDSAPVLVVIDTLAKNFGSRDENQSQPMSDFVRAAESIKHAFNCTIVIVHHTGKDIEKGARGSSALKAAIDQEYSVSAPKGAAKGQIVLFNHKMKDAPQPDSMTLQLKEVFIDEEMTSSCVVEQLNCSKTKRPVQGKNQLLVIETLRAHEKEQQNTLSDFDDEDFVIGISKNELQTKTRLNRIAIKQALDPLVEGNNIVEYEGLYSLT
jgi:RecA/RadA recombinase